MPSSSFSSSFCVAFFVTSFFFLALLDCCTQSLFRLLLPLYIYFFSFSTFDREAWGPCVWCSGASPCRSRALFFTRWCGDTGAARAPYRGVEVEREVERHLSAMEYAGAFGGGGGSCWWILEECMIGGVCLYFTSTLFLRFINR